MGYVEDKRLHDLIDLVGMRAQATSVGLVQLAIELNRAGVLDDAAVDRIKDAIAKEICLNRPKSVPQEHFSANLRARLDRLFAGEEPVGDARVLQD
ncbi:hypothetical protein HJG53_00680 [Sphingomonas sp. ID1715]|uniref:hypothetical protein n=1 Tax=Sphingomonas sp. ID1715 TaxID=1656898 RepID=UPI001489E343|nr:hypothetical protein [Sphingomonas sp. ID1715]NNM75424.1 hypothetical protein [Sphingomonas sp. ID1715]